MTVAIANFDTIHVTRAVRALATLNTRKFVAQLLSNHSNMVSADWDWFVSFCGYSVVMLRKG